MVKNLFALVRFIVKYYDLSGECAPKQALHPPNSSQRQPGCAAVGLRFKVGLAGLRSVARSACLSPVD